MVGLPARNDPVALGLTALQVDLAGQLDGGFHRLAAAGHEVEAFDPRRGHRRKASGQGFHRLAGEHGRMNVVTAPNLVGHGPGDFLAAVAHVDHQRPAGAVQEPVALSIGDPDPPGFGGNGQFPPQLPVKYRT